MHAQFHAVDSSGCSIAARHGRVWSTALRPHFQAAELYSYLNFIIKQFQSCVIATVLVKWSEMVDASESSSNMEEPGWAQAIQIIDPIASIASIAEKIIRGHCYITISPRIIIIFLVLVQYVVIDFINNYCFTMCFISWMDHTIRP